MIYKYHSDDPMNEKGKPWELRNRVEYRVKSEIGTTILKNGHFIDDETYNKVIARMKKN